MTMAQQDGDIASLVLQDIHEGLMSVLRMQKKCSKNSELLHVGWNESAANEKHGARFRVKLSVVFFFFRMNQYARLIKGRCVKNLTNREKRLRRFESILTRPSSWPAFVLYAEFRSPKLHVITLLIDGCASTLEDPVKETSRKTEGSLKHSSHI